MDAVEALHTAARRYCADRAAGWWRAGVDHTPYAWARHAVLEAVQVDIERSTPGEFASTADARDWLLEVSLDRRSPVRVRKDRGAWQARDEERRLFRAYVSALTERDLTAVEPLPYVRTLAPGESSALWSEVRRRWAVWLPIDALSDAYVPPGAEIFDAEPFAEMGVRVQLRDALSRHGVSRVFELVDAVDAPDRELDLVAVDPPCREYDRYWTDASFSWLVFAEGEHANAMVVIIGDHLVAAVRAASPEWEEWLYRRL